MKNACGSLFGLLLLTIGFGSSSGLANSDFGRPDPLFIEYPDDAPPTWREVQLGKTLFFDPRLSANTDLSCASCHNPDLGFGDGLRFSAGFDGAPLERHTPSLYNLAWSSVFFWDGRAATLEEQSLMPITSTQEMNLPLDVLVGRLSQVAYYQTEFNAIYGKGDIEEEFIARALAAFMRGIVSDNAPFDRFLSGDITAMSPAAQRGFDLFVGKAQCSQCHSGPNLTDDSFHNLGIEGDDKGRGEVVNATHLEGAFKTPGLRNVTLSAPYMRDGSIPSLEAVLEFYNRGGGPGPKRSELMKPLDLSAREIADMLAFLGALESPVIVKRPTIPR